MYVKYVRKNLHLFVLTITGLMFVICVTRAQVKPAVCSACFRGCQVPQSFLLTMVPNSLRQRLMGTMNET